jgi:hypothetical protein
LSRSPRSGSNHNPKEEKVNLNSATTEALEVAAKDLQQEVVRRKVQQFADRYHPNATLFQIDVQMEDHVFWLNIEPLNGPEPEDLTEPDQLNEVEVFMEEIGLPWAVGMTYLESILTNDKELKIEVDITKPLATLAL